MGRVDPRVRSERVDRVVLGGPGETATRWGTVFHMLADGPGVHMVPAVRGCGGPHRVRGHSVEEDRTALVDRMNLVLHMGVARRLAASCMSWAHHAIELRRRASIGGR